MDDSNGQLFENIEWFLIILATYIDEYDDGNEMPFYNDDDDGRGVFIIIPPRNEGKKLCKIEQNCHEAIRKKMVMIIK